MPERFSMQGNNYVFLLIFVV